MLRFSLSTLLCLIGAVPAFAERTVTVSIKLDGRDVLRSEYLDDGTAGPVDVWRDVLHKPPRAEPSLADVPADQGSPLRASLKGAIVLRIEAEGAVLGEAHLKELTLHRKNPGNNLWYLDNDEVYRTAYDAQLSDMYIGERSYKRLSEPVEVNGRSYLGISWWFILVPVLAAAAVFIILMYIVDCRSIRWYYAVPLGMLRATVYGLLAYMFLLPTLTEIRIWKPRTPPDLIKHSRVVVVLDVSDSMALHSDDRASAANRRTRLEKVIDFLTENDSAFLNKLLANNPVYFYRFASELDTEVYSFKNATIKGKEGAESKEIRPFTTSKSKSTPGKEDELLLARWSKSDWLNFVRYTDFKPWLLQGLSVKGQKEVKADFMGDAGGGDWVQAYLADSDDAILARLELPAADRTTLAGNLKAVRTQVADATVDLKGLLLQGLSKEGRKEVKADLPFDSSGLEWAEPYLAQTPKTILDRLKLSEEDASRLSSNLEAMKRRLETARSITQGTDIVESVQKAFESQKDNMLEGIIVFSDGRSNATVGGKDNAKFNPAVEALCRAAKKERVPIITIGVGEHREEKSVRITDLQAPDQTPPDDPWKINVEVDGEHMRGEQIDIFLELFPPNSDQPVVLDGIIKFDQSEPPHGQFEWTIDPADIVKRLGLESPKKKASLPEGKWEARARIAAIGEDGKPDAKKKPIYSDKSPILVQQKSVRILLMASVANRDFQYLMTQLIRDKADVSIFLQNDAGMFLDGKSIAFLEDKYRQLSHFPDKLYVEEVEGESEQTKWYNLARYDVIIAFDPDWTVLTDDQAKLIQTWVDLHAGGLLHVAGPINTKKLTFNEDGEVQRRLAPLLEIFPVSLGDNVLSKPRQERNVPRRLEFPGAAPDMDFLRLDDDKPDQLLSGWEPFFTGRETREQGLTAELKRGFYDYYPVKDIKPGAVIVARYLEPQASENTFDKKDPPYIVTFKYGQGMTAFLGSSEMWRFNQYRDAFRERFWVKMARYLASGSRRKQNRRGRILMAKEFVTGDIMRFTVQLLDASLKPLPVTAKPKFVLRPLTLDAYPDQTPAGKGPAGKKTAEPIDDAKLAQQQAAYRKLWTIEMDLTDLESKQTTPDGYFHGKRVLKAIGVNKRGLLQLQDDRLRRPELQAEIDKLSQDFPPGTWRLEVPIPESSELLTAKFVIRKPLPPEMVDLRPDLNFLASISSDVDDIKNRTKNPEAVKNLTDRAFYSPGLDRPRLAYRFDDKESLQMIPEIMRDVPQPIKNPEVEPEVRRKKIESRWFDGPALPRWMTSWYDHWMGLPEQSHRVALWMLVCLSLLSIEWLTRKLLKLA
jgi:hypothetical protein